MAGKKSNGNVVHLTIEILKDIRTELVLLREDTGRRFESLEGRFESLERTTAGGFAKLNARIETKLARLGPRHGR